MKPKTKKEETALTFTPVEGIEENFTYTFFRWEFTPFAWNNIAWFNKLRAIIFLKVIMPKSELIVDGLPIGKYLFLNSWIHKLIIYINILFLQVKTLLKK